MPLFLSLTLLCLFLSCCEVSSFLSPGPFTMMSLPRSSLPWTDPSKTVSPNKPFLLYAVFSSCFFPATYRWLKQGWAWPRSRAESGSQNRGERAGESTWRRLGLGFQKQSLKTPTAVSFQIIIFEKKNYKKENKKYQTLSCLEPIPVNSMLSPRASAL